jgi:UDP-N-acetyl-D-glucosamine dehydrogenase
MRFGGRRKRQPPTRVQRLPPEHPEHLVPIVSRQQQTVPSDVLRVEEISHHQVHLNGGAASDSRSRVQARLLAPRVAVVGLGYVGLPTALGMWESGASVFGIDVSRGRLAAIRKGQVDLLAQDLRRLEGALEEPNAFKLSADAKTLRRANAVLICVPTPVDSHRDPDLVSLRAACAAVVEHAQPGQVIVLTSTSYPGSTREMLAAPLEARGLIAGQNVFVACAPERIDPGNAAFPQRRVPRVVGGITAECTRRAAALIRRMTPKVHTVSSPEVAEMAKLVENSFRAVNIAFANEIAEVARSLDLSISEVIDAAATKPYGFMPFYPGSGVGGHCIPCDPHYLLWRLRANRVEAPILVEAMTAIAKRPHQIVSQISQTLSAVGRGIPDARVLIVGVTYKPNVRDTRGSPALEILAEIADLGGHVDYHDPLVSSVTLDGQRVLLSVAEPDAAAYDLVLIHTLHRDASYGWLDSARLVLDPSDRHHVDRHAPLQPGPIRDLAAVMGLAGTVDLTSEASNGNVPARRVAEPPVAFPIPG